MLQGKRSVVEAVAVLVLAASGFKQKSGPYAKYARPKEPQDVERSTHAAQKREFHPLIRPVGGEPVVLDGEELHRLCAQRNQGSWPCPSSRRPMNRTILRISQMLELGVQIVWVIDPETRDVSVYRLGRSPRLVPADGELTGDEVLPEFRRHPSGFFQPPA
jgi:hypothetical protein